MGRVELSVVMEYLLSYTEEVNEGIKFIAKELAKNEVKELKRTSPKRTGDYAKGWRVKKRGGPSFINIKIHNSKYPSLTHLLEHGRTTRNGGRTKAQPHIRPVEKRIQEEFIERIEALIKGGK